MGETNPQRLTGKRALVTGAAGDIGRAICARLVAEGARVAVADIDDQKGNALAQQLGASALFVPLDVTRDEAWRAAIETITNAWGGIDILVNNAGFLKPAHIEDATLDDWHAAMRVSGDGCFLGCKYGVAAMKADGGVIVNLSSTMGLRAASMHPAYSAAKGAVRLLTQSVAKHCGERGYPIRVIALLPGAIDSAMVRRNVPPGGSEPDYLDAVKARHPIGRLGTPDDIAGAVAFLASGDASFITGTDFIVDGGASL